MGNYILVQFTGYRTTVDVCFSVKHKVYKLGGNRAEDSQNSKANNKMPKLKVITDSMYELPGEALQTFLFIIFSYRDLHTEELNSQDR